MLSVASVHSKPVYRAPQVTLPPVTQVAIRSQVTFTYVFQGKQRSYRFPPLGMLLVDLEDKDALLAIRSFGGGCCGSKAIGGKVYFLEVPCH